MSMYVATDSHVYSFPVFVSVAAMIYLRIIPFWLSCGGGLQLRVMAVESITWPATLIGASLGPIMYTPT